MPDRSTSDGILTVRWLTRCAKELGIPLHICFVDLKKAYDKVHRDTLWLILSRMGVPLNMVTLIKQMHVGAKDQVLLEGILSEPFELCNGLKQGSVFSPILFNTHIKYMAHLLKLPQSSQLYILIR